MESEYYRYSEKMTFVEACNKLIEGFVKEHGCRPDSIEIGKRQFDELSSALRQQYKKVYVNKSDIIKCKIDGIPISIIDKPSWFKFRKLKARNSEVTMGELAESFESRLLRG